MRSLKPAPSVVLFVFCLSLLSHAQNGRDRHEEELLRKQWEECVHTCGIRIPHAEGRLRMLTGPASTKTNPDSGYYFKVGKAIADSMKAMQELEIDVIPTCQTGCNLVGLQLGQAELALVQSDVAHDAWYAHPPIATTPASDLKLVAQLYVEAAHLLVRPHLNIATLKELRGRQVWLGPKDSFTAFTARRILDAAGLNREDVDALENHCPRSTFGGAPPEACQKVRDLNSKEAMEKLGNLELDALFQVGPVPLDPVRDVLVPNKGTTPDVDPCTGIREARRKDPLFRDREIHFFSLDVDLVDRLVRDGSYVEQLIGADAYCQDKSSLTVGLRALLLTNQADHPAVGRLTNELFMRPGAPEKELKKQVVDEQMRHGDPVSGLPSQLGLLRVDVPESLEVRQIPHESRVLPWVKAEVLFLPAGLVVIVGLLHGFRRKLGPLLARRGEVVIGALGLLLAWVVTSALLWKFESHVNPSFATLPDAMLATVVGLSPWGDQPVTAVGQHYWTLCRGIAGFLFGGIVIAQFRQWASRGNQIAKDWLLGFGQPLRARGHAIILNNLPKKTEELIRELQANPSTDGQSIVIVAQGPVEKPPWYRDVRVVQGDPASAKRLREAQIKKTRSVTVFSAWPNPDPGDRRKFLRGDEADSRTNEALRAIRSICGKNWRFPKYVAEVRLRKNIDAARDAAGMPVEIICEEDTRAAAA